MNDRYCKHLMIQVKTGSFVCADAHESDCINYVCQANKHKLEKLDPLKCMGNYPLNAIYIEGEKEGNGKCEKRVVTVVGYSSTIGFIIQGSGRDNLNTHWFAKNLFELGTAKND